MANPAHLHLMLNHVPLLGTAFGLGLVGWALLRKSEELKKISLGVFVIVAVLAVPAYLMGEPAEKLVENLPDVSKRFSRPDIQLAQQINVDTHSPGELIVDEKLLEKLQVGYRELHRGIHVETPP